MNYDTPEAIAITDKAAKELLEVEKLKAVNAKLLEALKISQKLLKKITPFRGQEHLLSGAIELNDLVISKAEGKQA